MKMWSSLCPRHERTNNPKFISSEEGGRDRDMAPVLSSTPEVGELSVSRPGHYTSGKEARYQPNRRFVWGPKDGMEVWMEKMFAMFRDSSSGPSSP
jgi:hypothetical protein